MDYSQKLKDPRWQKKRLKIFERDGWACRYCKNETKSLEVHHLRYTIPDPWDENDSNLVTLCDDCHRLQAGKIYRSSDFWPVIKMSNGTFLKGPKAEIVGRWS